MSSDVSTFSQSNSSVKSEDSGVYSVVYRTVEKYLSDETVKSQKMTVSYRQNIGRNILTIHVNEISKIDAIKETDTKYFDAAFDAADNRKALKKACNQAKEFFKEQILQKNPFPPRQRFLQNVRSLKKKDENDEICSKTKTLNSTKSSISSVSLHKLTTIKSNSTLSQTASNISKAPKQTKIPDSLYHRVQSDKNKKVQRSMSPKEEKRFINTLNNSEY